MDYPRPAGNCSDRVIFILLVNRDADTTKPQTVSFTLPPLHDGWKAVHSKDNPPGSRYSRVGWQSLLRTIPKMTFFVEIALNYNETSCGSIRKRYYGTLTLSRI